MCSGAGAGAAASAAGPSCNLIGWTVWCFGAGGKKTAQKGIPNIVNVIFEKLVTLLLGEELRKTVVADLLQRTGRLAVLCCWKLNSWAGE